MIELKGCCVFNIFSFGEQHAYIFKTDKEDIRIFSKKNIKTKRQVKIYGDWDMKNKQFVVSDYTYSADTDEELLYLLSYEAEGGSPDLANELYQRFGSWLREALKHPEIIKNFFPAGDEEKVRRFCESFRDLTYRNLAKMVLISKYEFPQDVAERISDLTSEEEITHIVESNIYKFCGEPFLVPFKLIDRIALKYNLSGVDSEERLKWLAVNFLEEAEFNGNLFMEQEELVAKLKDSANSNYGDPLYTEEKIDAMLNNLFKDGKTIRQCVGRVYLARTEHAEKMFAAEIAMRLQTAYTIENEVVESAINEFEQAEGISLEEDQRKAVAMAVKNQVLILTGGPGTGKTTIVKAIIAVLKKLHEYQDSDFTLMAPTGKAAKRMSESTGKAASTIHSAICIGDEDENAGRKLNGKVIIIDECSMLDQRVAYALIEAIPRTSKIIFVGDVDQLQSVGAGDVLNGMISSGVVPVVKLTVIHRQKGTSRVITNAAAINSGNTRLVYGNDFSFIEVKGDHEAFDKVVQIYEEYARKYGADNVALLCPRRKDTEVCVQSLNPILQKRINKNPNTVTVGDSTFIVGDRIIQTKNDAVANGEIGKIIAIYKELSCDERSVYRFKIDFSGKILEYTESDMKHVELAYATTVHKSQGSEYDYVIIPVLFSHSNMLKRNLLYTAVTRAKKGVCIVGQKGTLKRAIKNNTVAKRNTLLADRLVKYSKKVKSE